MFISDCVHLECFMYDKNKCINLPEQGIGTQLSSLCIKLKTESINTKTERFWQLHCPIHGKPGKKTDKLKGKVVR